LIRRKREPSRGERQGKCTLDQRKKKKLLGDRGIRDSHLRCAAALLEPMYPQPPGHLPLADASDGRRRGKPEEEGKGSALQMSWKTKNSGRTKEGRKTVGFSTPNVEWAA